MSAMDQVMSNLWIGDYSSSQAIATLQRSNIKHVVCAMRQTYPTQLPSTIKLLQIPVDDTANANLLSHFAACCDFIAAARLHSEGVLVHCQAGVSRSSSIVIAYLIRELGMTVDQATAKVKKARTGVEPSETFKEQLGIWERCDGEWNPAKWNEQRRFLMSYAQTQIMDGASPSLVLAYYPSPDASPAASPSTDGHPSLPKVVSPPTSPLNPAPPPPLMDVPAARKRLTTSSRAAKAEQDPAAAAESNTKELPATQKDVSVEKIGTKADVVVSGRRIRCKMCRRELAARQHILTHQPGVGQQAFAPNKRDASAIRLETEARRLDEIAKEAAEAAAGAAAAPTTTLPSQPPSLAGLRIAQPISAPAIPGLRMAVPIGGHGARPPVARPPVMRPKPAAATAAAGSTSTANLSAPIAEAAPQLPTLPASASSEPPLLPSHLCSSYFVEPLSWMSPLLETGEISGKLVCPGSKCGAKLGSWDWAGSQCSCGAWVCPGFALNVSRVDEVVR